MMYRALGAVIPISLQIDTPYQIVGRKGKFRIIGAPPGAEIYWSSYKDGVATGELNSSYGDKIGANGTAELEVSWAPDQMGNWVKEILVQDSAGTNYTAMVQFSVMPAAQSGAVATEESWLEKGFEVGGIKIPYWLAGVGAFFALKKR